MNGGSVMLFVCREATDVRTYCAVLSGGVYSISQRRRGSRVCACISSSYVVNLRGTYTYTSS